VEEFIIVKLELLISDLTDQIKNTSSEEFFLLFRECRFNLESGTTGHVEFIILNYEL
jgi:hypothetical protein